MKYIPENLDLERVSVLINTLSGSGPETCEIADSAYHVFGYVLRQNIYCPHDNTPVRGTADKSVKGKGKAKKVEEPKDFGSVSNDEKIKALECLRDHGPAEMKALEAKEGEEGPDTVGVDFPVPWDLIRLIIMEILNRYLPSG